LRIQEDSFDRVCTRVGLREEVSSAVGKPHAVLTFECMYFHLLISFDAGCSLVDVPHGDHDGQVAGPAVQQDGGCELGNRE
jgi:hypothetical protein